MYNTKTAVLLARYSQHEMLPVIPYFKNMQLLKAAPTTNVES